MQAALPFDTLLMRFVIPASPQPQERARMGANGHWYTPTRSREYCELVMRAAKYALEPDEAPMRWWRDGAPLRPEVAIVYREPAVKIYADFFFGTRRRMDVDNCQKAIADALVKAGVIRDDSYTVLRGWSVTSAYDKLNPRAEIEIHRAEPVAKGKRR